MEHVPGTSARAPAHHDPRPRAGVREDGPGTGAAAAARPRLRPHHVAARCIHDLARHYTVIAPDLLGHGVSAKPRADYSVGGYANGMRDLLTVLNIDKVTVVGHSFGGGIAMQFAYQFPERTERMILVAPGGLGPEVSPFIRAVTLPGFHQAMGVATLPGHPPRRARPACGRSRAHGAHRRPRPRRGRRDLRVVQGPPRPGGDPPRGARRGRHEGPDRHHGRPGLPHPGDADAGGVGQPTTSVIPVKHAENVARIAPGAVVEVLPNSGHFPHKDHPDRFVKIVQSFVRATQPASYHRGRWRQLLRNGPTEPVNRAEAGERTAARAQWRRLPQPRRLQFTGNRDLQRQTRGPIRFSSAVSVRRRGDDDDQAEHDQDRAEPLEQRVEVLDRRPRQARSRRCRGTIGTLPRRSALPRQACRVTRRHPPA